MTFALLTACGSLDAFELLDLYHEGEPEFGSYVLDMTADITMSPEEGVDMYMLLTRRVEAESEDRSREISTSSLPILDQSEETVIYIRDGYEYYEVSINGNIDFRDRFELNSGGSRRDGLTRILTEDIIYESIATSTDDGYQLEFILNIDGVSAALEGLDLEDIVNDQLNESEDEENEDVESTMVVYLDEDHMLTSLTITLVEIDVAIDDAVVVLTLDVELLTRQDITIDFPDWLDDF